MSELVKKSHGCLECSLSGKSAMVTPEGDLATAKLVVVGQNPGPEERRLLRPFIGPCKYVFELLQEATGITREECYITNSCKCTELKKDPSESSYPNPEIWNRCGEQWKEEWEAMKGKRVLLLGEYASRRFFRSYKHHALFRYRADLESVFLEVWHPSYLLRQKAPLSYYSKSLEFVNCLLKWPGKKERVIFDPVTKPSELQDVVSYFHKQDMFSFDIETVGTDPYIPDSRILCISFSDGVRTMVIDWDGLGETADGVVRTLMQSSARKVAQNGKYDITWLKVKKKIEVCNFWFDPMIAQHLLDEGRYPSVALSQLIMRHFPKYIGWSEEMDYDHIEKEPKAKVMHYSAVDAYVEAKLALILEKQIQEHGLDFLYHSVLMSSVQALADAEIAGLYLDLDAVKREKQKLSGEIETVEADLRRIAAECGMEEGFNLNSTYYLRKLFFDGLKVEPVVYTRKKQKSLNYAVLEKYKKDIPAAQRVLDYRSLNKVRSTYYENYIKLVRSDGFVHPSFNMTVVITGRLSCWNPNVQNVPEAVRRVFTSRFPEGKLMEVDFKQMELRMLAIHSGDQNLLKVFLEGGDPHATTASAITGIPVEEIISKYSYHRRDAKTTNFGIIYGMNVYGLAQKFGGIEKARKFYDGFFRSYPKVARWQKKQEWLISRGLPVVSLFGRTWDLSRWKFDDARGRAFNYPIQSDSAYITRYVMGMIHDLMETANMRTCIIADGYDSLLFDSPKEEVSRVKTLANAVVASLPTVFSWIVCPLEIDVKVGDNWEEVC